MSKKIVIVIDDNGLANMRNDPDTFVGSIKDLFLYGSTAKTALQLRHFGVTPLRDITRPKSPKRPKVDKL